ncbi:predicted protein [Naegleria gruberi]|uniref:Predicted protein n=1 Tax=Naegleria gruberi TaxID=5762 RepID=D2VE78_NAEGR|nr:uncharacterized protein NAEGRDRAFT_67181 [Naegleria gruberi]EFC44834.1 predicted protein [Naegleria gruberi]|eukprot:XP_002677578.1 predicted protein [Naegleria gruberi strain NEG-M]
MPPRRARTEEDKKTSKKSKSSTSSSGDNVKVQKKRKQTKSTSSKRGGKDVVAPTVMEINDDSQQDQEFYFNLWGQEVNEDLMQYILDFVPVYPDLLNMRATNRFWKNKLEKVFFPKVKVLDLLTREKNQIEKFKSTKLKQMASYFPNFTKLRVCQSGWEAFFQQPNKIETFEFFDLECVALATGLFEFLDVLVDCHKNNKHSSDLKTVNIYGTSENGYIYFGTDKNKIINYLNGLHNKKETPMSSLETINLKYHNTSEQLLTRLKKVKADNPITEYDNVLEFWDMLVYEENINWNLLHPFKLVELKNDDLYDVIIEYAKAQDIPVQISEFESELARSDLLFDEFYKKFVANTDLEPHLRYKMDRYMLNRIFQNGNDHLLNLVIENKEIPLIIEGAYNPLTCLVNNRKITLLKKALEREPTLLNLGNSNGIIEGNAANMNLLYCLFKSNVYSYSPIPFDIVKSLIDLGVDLNYTCSEGSILSYISDYSAGSLSLFENIELETLEKTNSNGLNAIENWASRLRQFGSYNSMEFLKFFNKIYQRNGKELKDFRSSNGGNLLHILSRAPSTLTDYAITTLGVDISHKNNDEIPALFVVNSSMWSSTLLASLKLEELNSRDANGQTLLCKSLLDSERLSSLLVERGCDLEYALSNVPFKSEFFELKKGEPYINGAKLLLYYAFARSINYFSILNKSKEVLKKCLEIEITMSSETLGVVNLTPVHTYLMLGIETQTIADLGLITRKRYIVNGSVDYGNYTDENEGMINYYALQAMNGIYNEYCVNSKLYEEESSITKLNSWKLAVKYGHYRVAKKIIHYLGKPLDECESTINELASANLQYHILEESLKRKLKEKNLVGDDKKLISGYIFNFTPFGDFSELEPVEDLIDSDLLEQKCIVQLVNRDENRELTEFLNNYGNTSNPSTIKYIGKMYSCVQEPVTYQLSMLEVCALKGYPLKKIQEKLTTEKEILQFLSRMDKKSGKTIMHLLCDSSLPVYFRVEKRELHSYKHSLIVSLLSKLSAASKKKVLNLLDDNHETPIFAAIRADFKNLVKSLAPNTDMSLRNSQGKNCLEISQSEIIDILIQYADKKTLASKRQIDEEQKSRKKKK